MQRFKLWLGSLIFTLIFTACYKKVGEQGDFFYLQNKNVYLPVWVRGNMNAEQIIIMIHGGPGGDDGVYMHLASFRSLQDRYLMVYYDQRASGASQSSFVTSYTANDHIQDLEKLVHLIQDKYGKNRKIVLMGHSWGGMLGGLYLEKGRNRGLIQGFINVDGAYMTITRAEYDALISTANMQIALGNSIKSWQRIIHRLNKINPDHLSLYDLSVVNSLGYEAESLLQNDDFIKGPQGFDAYNYYYNSAFHPGIYAMNELFVNTLMFRQAYAQNLNLKDEIQNLTTPTCLLWGLHDLVVAASTVAVLNDELPQPIYSFLFENSGHSPMITEPFEFVSQAQVCMTKFSEP